MKVEWGDYYSDLFSALLKTLEYTVLGFVGAVLLGLAVALMRRSPQRILRIPAAIYTELFKNIPLLAIIFITYFGLSSAGVILSTMTAGTLSLVVFYAAYLSEIFRAGLNGVHARTAGGRPGVGDEQDALLPAGHHAAGAAPRPSGNGDHAGRPAEVHLAAGDDRCRLS